MMRKRWQYKTLEIKPKSIWTSTVEIEDIDEDINMLGSEGWELVSVVPKLSGGTSLGYLYTFKREL